jgi:hypothetical protein
MNPPMFSLLMDWLGVYCVIVQFMTLNTTKSYPNRLDLQICNEDITKTPAFAEHGRALDGEY